MGTTKENTTGTMVNAKETATALPDTQQMSCEEQKGVKPEKGKEKKEGSEDLAMKCNQLLSYEKMLETIRLKKKSLENSKTLLSEEYVSTLKKEITHNFEEWSCNLAQKCLKMDLKYLTDICDVRSQMNGLKIQYDLNLKKNVVAIFSANGSADKNTATAATATKTTIKSEPMDTYPNNNAPTMNNLQPLHSKDNNNSTASIHNLEMDVMQLLNTCRSARLNDTMHLAPIGSEIGDGSFYHVNAPLLNNAGTPLFQLTDLGGNPQTIKMPMFYNNSSNNTYQHNNITSCGFVLSTQHFPFLLHANDPAVTSYTKCTQTADNATIKNEHSSSNAGSTQENVNPLAATQKKFPSAKASGAPLGMENSYLDLGKSDSLFKDRDEELDESSLEDNEESTIINGVVVDGNMWRTFQHKALFVE
ncbi:hypothetical protein RFI_06983 [Reticulomyxa filosa]|uniref:Uncharacterized protein n=1 Tax=Reticulomyxa filosa TaxID=46433 RepID=X6NVT8_RETFI|nr:hypothetical protein RFI_06983 [Reticulomyxa filosa]|eukprot:ETO30136.1 hypothetical protein RFI_06983 [Reticulomyxa filosa]